MDIREYFKELKRRNVFKAALAYLVVAWIIVQVISIIFPVFNISQDLLKTIIIVLIVGFPVWLVFAWIYEVTPEGLKRTEDISRQDSITAETSNKFNKVIIGALVVAIILLSVNLYSNYSEGRALKDNESNHTEEVIPASKGKEKSIAVLAFDDMSPGKDHEYFSDGISDEILNLLAKIPDLKVISRTSSFYFKGKEATAQEIGQKLHVSHLLEGNVRKAGNTLRITAQLVNVADGSQIWSKTYDRKMEDVFKIQDEIADNVTSELKANLLGKEVRSNITDTEAYNFYLEAKQLLRQSTPESVENAEFLLRRSIKIDSTYAPAWILMSKIMMSKTLLFNSISIEKGTTKGISAAKKAIQIDPKNASAYAVLGRQQTFMWNGQQEAYKNVQKALHLEPDNIEVINTGALNKTFTGKTEKAVELYLKTKRLDPLNFNWELGFTYWMNGEFEKAEKEVRNSLLHMPNMGVAHSILSLILVYQEKYEEALIEAEKEPAPFFKLWSKCRALYGLGRYKEADAALEKLITQHSEDGSSNIAEIYAFRNKKDKAFEWLEKSYSYKNSDIYQILNFQAMKNLHGDPRWNGFIKKLPLPEDHGFHLD
ncbi:hypothetical protein [Zunongwangia sp. H14]|uniref:hypothetical protein n=1 Tax=Zunongwangia sp. H14 TaxID=3240792 RepID=UPI00356785C2